MATSVRGKGSDSVVRDVIIVICLPSYLGLCTCGTLDCSAESRLVICAVGGLGG